ncbi:hypothetical protein TRICHSKD4_1890 [Roseibium sp. TrichSKD4]|nr:hypothetical protein TRICHSKD4_1890 [Roseibium sp. TrichSKD4]
MTMHHPKCFAEADHSKFSVVLSATETTAVVLEMIGCFFRKYGQGQVERKRTCPERTGIST